jgi:BirA family biotin operon repressor/biotin-[acetyl-CoA-carboxylase] ligase
MSKPSRGIDVSKLEEGVATKALGHTILFSHEVGSTNEWAKHLAKLGANEGTVTIADVQKTGRGRLGRKWISPEGGLWFSVIFRRPKLTAKDATELVFVAGLAVAETLRELYDLPSETKWPNDVLIHGRKVCGILCEASVSGNSVDSVVVGLGLNANIRVRDDLPKKLRETATSLEDELGRRVELEKLFHCLIRKLEMNYSLLLAEGFLPILGKWKKHAAFLGRKIVVTNLDEKLVGLAVDVDEEGKLLLKTENRVIHKVTVGDVSLQLDTL